MGEQCHKEKSGVTVERRKTGPAWESQLLMADIKHNNGFKGDVLSFERNISSQIC
jgi:hypothetical protein